MPFAPCPVAASRVSRHAIPIHVPFAIATETLPAAEVLVLALTDAEGRVGLGEASPFPSLTRDDAGVAAAVLADLTGALQGLAPHAALGRLALLAPEARARSVTAACAMETALLDLLARQAGVPLAFLFGSAALTHVETDVTLPILPPEAVAGFWERFAPYGFGVVKVKVGGDVAADEDLVRRIHALAGPRVRLTLDGNQGFTVETALRLLDALARAGITVAFFEQPLPRDDHDGARRLAARSPVPVCLDESVTSAAEAMAAVNERRGHMINLKIMKAGVRESAAIAAVAQAAGWPLMMGGMLESEIAMGASLQLAAGLGTVTHFDLDTPFFFTRSLAASHPWQAKSARLTVPQGDGLGLSLAPAP